MLAKILKLEDLEMGPNILRDVIFTMTGRAVLGADAVSNVVISTSQLLVEGIEVLSVSLSIEKIIEMVDEDEDTITYMLNQGVLTGSVTSYEVVCTELQVLRDY